MAQTAGFVALSLLWTIGEARPIGLAVGGSVERELADPSPDERRERPLVAGIVGVDARFELRSMRTPWVLVAGVGGVAGAEVATSGWTPVWEAVVETGLAVSPAEAGMHVGGRLVKDLSPCFADCDGGTGLLARAGLGTEVVGGLAGMRSTKPTGSAGLALRLTPLRSDL